MQLAQFALVIVKIGRPQHNTAQATLGYEGIGAFGWIGRDFLGLIKGAEMLFEDIPSRIRLGKEEGLIQITEPERLNDFAVRAFHNA